MKNSAMVKIREETRDDHDAVGTVNDRAFNQATEGNIIRKIRTSGIKCLSLVAEIEGKVAGHIFYSPVTLDEFPTVKNGMGLAPMAVLPEYQGQGIGKLLVNESINRLKAQSVPFIIVLGHPHYYPKFGFEKASHYRIGCQWEGVPDEAFMILILDKGLMKDKSGIARYCAEWDEAM